MHVHASVGPPIGLEGTMGGETRETGPGGSAVRWKRGAFRRGDDTVGNPHRAQMFNSLELILLLKV